MLSPRLSGVDGPIFSVVMGPRSNGRTSTVTPGAVLLLNADVATAPGGGHTPTGDAGYFARIRLFFASCVISARPRASMSGGM
jgi:hypothetical protein